MFLCWNDLVDVILIFNSYMSKDVIMVGIKLYLF